MYMPVINTFNVRRMSERRFSLFMVLWGLMALAAMAQTRYYVTPDGQAPKVENAWDGPFYGLEDALSKAVPGDEIWVQGLEAGAVYKVDAKDKPFFLKAGVRLYGGFYGNETDVEQRATQGKACSFTFRSVLSADLNGDDRIDPTSLIYTGNTTRQDNAVRVLEVSVDCAQSDNKNNERSVVDGFTIMGGHAEGQNGGGIEVKGGEYACAYTISRCFFFNNYAAQGGALYVEGNADEATNTSLIERCMVYNNAAGQRGELRNAGGGIWLEGAGTVVNTSVFNNENGGVRISPSSRVVNSTVARNTVAGIDMTRQTDDYAVFNTVVWGNTALFDEISPKFKSSSYHEVTDAGGIDADGNIYVSDKNNDRSQASPFFSSPSQKTSFDRDFDWNNDAYPIWAWEVLEGSAFIDKGADEVYTDYGEVDLSGYPRFSNGRIDIGAYEFQAVPAERVLRVKQGASSVGADGKSWETAFPDVQAAINRLAETGQAGEVWIARGEYAPTELMGNGKQHTAAFIMKEGINVYGGFAGTETHKGERKLKDGGMPWEYEYLTVLKGSGYVSEDEAGRKCVWSENDQKWTVSGSNSSHVVWFARMDGSAFTRSTVLDGVTIKGGSARVEYAGDYDGDRGGGVYMQANAYLNNCIVTENSAEGNGGAVYMEGGCVSGSLIYNNNADGSGGGVYMDNTGIVLRSMLANNSADDGGGIYMASHEAWFDGRHPEYLILSTSVVSNNTSRKNGAVYCDRGGVVLHATITNNNTPNGADASASRTSRTGGLYVDEYALVVNSVLWNNQIDGINVPVYADNSSVDKVRFFYTAVSGMGNAVWNNTLQQNLISLTEANSRPEESVISPDFETEKMPQDIGVQAGWTSVDYHWIPQTGSNLRARGLTLGQFPEDVLLNPELDIRGTLFAQKPCLGAVAVKAMPLHPQEDGDVIRLYVDMECTTPSYDGSSWEKAYRSVNEAIACFAAYDEEKARGKSFEICITEGDCYPRYAFTNLDPKTATVNVSRMPGGATLTIKGGYQRMEGGVGERDPLTYRTWINGNPDGTALEDGIYHCITVEAGAKVVFDGLHVTGGYAAGEATSTQGAGLLVASGADVTVRNTVFENNTAVNGAAISASAAKLTLENCVVNNNTNTTETNPVILCNDLTMYHVTVVNNMGSAPADMGASSFSAGNTAGADTFTGASLGVEGAKNFANPTNQAGATMGYDTYLGGYSSFLPNTSSAEAGSLINKAAGTPSHLDKDIAGKGRNLGGMPDKGAYEADLPENGTVLYVTAGGAGRKDGSSWENAIAGNEVYDLGGKNTLGVSTTDSRYVGFYDASARPYGETSGASKLFFEHFNENNLEASNVNYKTEFHDGVTHVTGASGINIRNKRYERYIGGLQYAVERAASSAESGQRVQVWVAGGTYTDYKGFVIRDKVEVLGGFPASGTPGLDDRHPLLSQYIPANQESEGLEKNLYETILQIQETNPVNNSGSLPGRTRKPVLFQPDVCLPTKSPSGRESSYSYWEWGWTWNDWSNHWINKGYGNSVPGADETASNTYRWENQEGGYVEYEGATWDGFTIRHGFYKGYQANRDGGAGVRMFRGVTLQNCVVTENYNSSGCTRGAGIYCDGENSKVVNCFILNNRNEGGESYGGGMYMILGTGYNNLVANNYAQTHGGGIFIEAATFYNNTIAYNQSNGTGGLHQYFSDSYGSANLRLYNCLIYGNSNAALGFVDVTKFNGAYNSYIQSNVTLSDEVLRRLHDCYSGSAASSNPFEKGDEAATENNYRLSAATVCLNHGTEDLGDNISLPATDVDFTDRIKDCTVDIGAYERNNEDAVKADADGIFYVTFNGKGTAVGDSPANAACAMKLQEVLNAAGRLAASRDGVTVKIAGYEGANVEGVVYHANTLSDPKDPQSYTFVIPAGVTVKGGYWEGTSTEEGNWDEASPRDAARYMTVLSAVSEATGTRQEVNGYHAVQFGTEATAALEKPAVLDGVYLEDGQATSTVGYGDSRTRGGGTIVPKNAHVRNCVVRNNTATEGGGLFVLPGGRVSGCGVMGNTAEKGAGIYAGTEGKDMSQVETRSYIISSTVAGNTATGTGGGIFVERGAALTANTVVWGNTAPSDKNVSGITQEVYPDALFASIDSKVTAFYPFNNCFVETYEMPSNYGNKSMTTEWKLYFKNDYYVPREFSALIKHGASVRFQKNWVDKLDVSVYDMQGNLRAENTSDEESLIDAGAYAHPGGTMKNPENAHEVVRRIFVSPLNNTELTEEEAGKEGELLGCSFYTSLFHLGDALEYIRQVRASKVIPNAKDIEFEIWLAEGTYKPLYTREGGADESAGEPSQRDNSYVIPDNVKLFGGFKGDEPYAWGEISLVNASGVHFEDISNYAPEQIQDLLNKRESGEFSGNGVKEPWDFAHQTILSGRVNVAEGARNVYHVIYSRAEDDVTDSKGVVLDGLTIMDGETASTLEGQKEIGRGGGIYTYGVDYTLNRCRLLNNKAVRGGALHALNADVVVSGSVFAGNGTVDNPKVGEGTTVNDVRGGAVYVAGSRGGKASFKAVNTLWVNNEADGALDGQPSMGGALATSGEDVTVELMNNTLARNKASKYAALYVPGGLLTNTVVWGNEGEGAPVSVAKMVYSASDVPLEDNVVSTGFVQLDSRNNHIDGPRFSRPSTVAGVEGYVSDARWNPGAISVLVDAGHGEKTVGGEESGAYCEWMNSNKEAYQGYMAGDKRYAGPKDEQGQEQDKKIDIGLYEYQYPTNLYSLDAVYVATEESGDRSGESWENATSDLRGALNAMANSTGSQTNPSTIQKKVFIKAGEYSIKTNLYTGNVAYQINMGTTEDIVTKSLTVKGSYNDAGKQDFGQPTVISAKDGNTILLDVSTKGKPVTVEGLTFRSGNTGVRANASGEGKLTLKNVASRANITGIDLTESNGDILIVNTLMGDGQTGLRATTGTTVVNATFAQNQGKAVEGTPKAVYNSVAWRNSEELDGLSGNGNVSLGTAENSDIEHGPNFVDPDNGDVLSRDYRIRPNLTLLDKGDNAAYQREVLGKEDEPIPSAESDLAGSQRAVGEGIDVGAYEYASELKPVIYVKAGVAGGDQSGSDWANAMGDLQGAADLATVYAQGHEGENGYVFVHGNVKGLPLRLARQNVKVYGSMADEAGETPDAVLAARKGLLEVSGRSSLSSLEMTGASVVDGFEVKGEDNRVSAGMLSTSILASGSKLDLGTGGVLYNSIVDGATVDGQGKAVNVTAVNGGTLGDASKENTVEAGQENGYVADGYWAYQLKETDTGNIDGGKTDIETYMTRAGHEKDLAGNLRVRGTVDNGCFETWNVEGSAEVTDGDYPHGKSVVYVREGGELRLKRGYASASPFNPGFLLLEHGAGLWGGGRQVALTHFAAERKLVADNGYKDLVAMPFRVDRMTVDGKEDTQVGIFRYDGNLRAGHDYAFEESDSKAWRDISSGVLEAVTEGLLFEAPEGHDKDMTLRFYGTDYKEDGQPKSIELKQYNFNAPWSSADEDGDKFTHKENMGWNLFGSPYLCTMNYEDMEYGRVVYGYANDGYYTAMGLSSDGTRVQGNIPAGSAVFTQTATLKEKETFDVGMRAEEVQEPVRSTDLALYIAPEAGKRGVETGGIHDELQLMAVPSEEASMEFDLAHDGVKWMNDNGEPEIFAVRDGGRYSLLSAIDREGTIGVGVSLPEAGMYSIGIPEDCEAGDYEYVILKDAATGKAADLKEGAYSFRTAEAGVAEGRFTLSFKRMDADQRHDIYVKSGMGKATVFGVADGDAVTVVTVDGKIVATEEATGNEVAFVLARGAYLFKVAGADGRTTVVKAMVR